ncbi:cytoplasmic tRNA 2-thiolation protein 2 [Leptodactylus fuscus]|uniref:cytoplasmic tRNA 2-thiolation protein 2 n=1 Tax=Leptodactylus fuscus TaxID=238119 RepID=UPI003F4EA66A
MCDVQDLEYMDLGKEEKCQRLGKTCMKCKEGAAVVVIRVGDAFCKSCFRDYFVHKFRAMLGKNRVVYPGEKVLLAYSGGASSSAMIHQVQEGLSREAPKKLRFTPGILFIDEGAVCGQSWEQREQTLSEVQQLLKKTNFPFYIVALEQVFNFPQYVLQSALPVNPKDPVNYKQAVNNFLGQKMAHPADELGGKAHELAQLFATGGTYSRPPVVYTSALIGMFSNARTLTAKLELLQCLRSHLIMIVALTCGYPKVMTGESCTRLATRLLSNISLGRGAFLPLDTGFSDDRYGNVITVRPMREYSLKEISFYNRLFNVPSVFIPTLETKAPDNSSIQHLSESFITKLQADFPSTVSTMYRTSEKLNISRADVTEENVQQERCLICMCTLDTCIGDASAFSATQVSQRLSQRKPNKNAEPTGNPERPRCNNEQCCDRSSSCSSSVLDTEDFMPLLCYGCRLTVRDMISVSAFPPYILQEAEQRSRRLGMRREIQEFLLDEGCEDL